MWKRLERKVIFKHPRITLLEDTVELPNGQTTDYLSFEHTNDSATVICLRGNEVLLSQEYSYPVDEILYQFPGGKISLDKKPEVEAARELQEETGYIATDMELLGWYYVDNRRTANRMYVFLTRDPSIGRKEGGDLEEDITSKWVQATEIQRMIQEGEITNYSVLAAWVLYQGKQAATS